MTEPDLARQWPLRNGSDVNVERVVTAEAYGVPEAAVIILPLRNIPPIVIPPTGDTAGGGRLPPGLAVAYAGDPVFWLDRATRTRRDGEDDMEYGYRLWLELVDRGMLEPETGMRRSPLAMLGVDIAAPEIVARLEAYRDGEVDEDLAAVVIERAGLSVEDARAQASELAHATREVLAGVGRALDARIAETMEGINRDLRDAPGELDGKLALLRHHVDQHRTWVGPLLPAAATEVRQAMAAAFDVIRQALVDLWDLEWLPRSRTLPESAHATARASHDVGLRDRIDQLIEDGGDLYQRLEEFGGQEEDLDALCEFLSTAMAAVVDDWRRLATGPERLAG